MDAFKETLDAWLARIKSPVLGYIVLAFVLVNWKPLWFLVFADQSVIDKFEFFDARTDGWSLYVWPVSIGLVAATAAPWVEFIGAWIARIPTRLRLVMQAKHDTDIQVAALENATRLEIAKAFLDEKKEQASLEKSRRLMEAEKISKDAVAALGNPVLDSPTALALRVATVKEMLTPTMEFYLGKMAAGKQDDYNVYDLYGLFLKSEQFVERRADQSDKEIVSEIQAMAGLGLILFRTSVDVSKPQAKQQYFMWLTRLGRIVGQEYVDAR